MYSCRLCKEENPDNSHYYKFHKITIKNYFEVYENRRDLFDNSIIEFKGNVDDYFSKSFVSRYNLSKWLKKVSKEEYERYIYTYLIDRKARKNLTYSPTQVELKTLLVPGIKWITENVKDYYELCKELGYQNRFNKYKLDESLAKDISKKVIFKDTREQKPLELDNQVRTKTIQVGDYRMAGSNLRVERKSINDFYGTMSGGFERFCKEIIRAQDQDNYLIILVEGSFNSIYGFSKLPYLKTKKLPSPEFVIFNMRTLLEENNHIQILFVDDREEASRCIEKIFSYGDEIKNVDVQYLYDLKEF